jgi:hypothetical protein
MVSVSALRADPFLMGRAAARSVFIAEPLPKVSSGAT